MSSAPARDLRVFVNCPFDDKYIKIFHAIVFAIHDVGFQARHALIDNSSVLRMRRIYEEVEGSLYSIHELGQVALSSKSKLPRFNMPFEAGIAYSMHEAGAKGGQPHHMLLLDKTPYRIQVSMSDAAGIDGRAHHEDPALAIEAVRGFLSNKSGLPLLGGTLICKRYALFMTLLRRFVRPRLTVPEVKSWNYVNDMQAIMVGWIQSNPPRSAPARAGKKASKGKTGR